MDFNSFQDKFKDAFVTGFRDNMRKQMNESPERVAEARQSVEALSGLLEVVRENASNIIDDAQKGLILLSDYLGQAQAKVTEDTVRKEAPNWDSFFANLDEWEKEVKDEPEATADDSEPVVKGVPTTLDEKFEWLVDNAADKIWPNGIARDSVRKKDETYTTSLNTLKKFFPESIDALFAKYYKA